MSSYTALEIVVAMLIDRLQSNTIIRPLVLPNSVHRYTRSYTCPETD